MRIFVIVTLLFICLCTNVAIANKDKGYIDYVAVGNVPEDTMSEIKKPVDELDNHPFNIYKVGYFLTDFIASEWGQDSLINLVETNGNVQESLNVSVNEFEKMWLSFLQDKHKLKYSEVADVDC